MGKSPKPLQIWVDETLKTAHPWEDLTAQGHLVVIGDGIKDYVCSDFDLMLGPQCWRMNDALLKHLDLALKGARALRYETKLKLCARIVMLSVLLCAILASPSLACDRFPVSPGTQVREYMQPNGLTYREYDTDGDGDADYGTATQPDKTWPLFYARGFDDPMFFRDKDHPFVASVVWKDIGGSGRCEDIRIQFIRENREPWNPDSPANLEVQI